MERRSRSTTRNRPSGTHNGELSSHSHQNSVNLSRDARHTSIGRSFPEIPTNSSLLQRVGGDSRTLSPERKSHNYGFPKTSPHHSMSKSGSYNVYTHGQPPPIPPPPQGAPHGGHNLNHSASAIVLGVNGTTSNPVPPPRAPVNSNIPSNLSSSQPPQHSRNNSNNNSSKVS